MIYWTAGVNRSVVCRFKIYIYTVIIHFIRDFNRVISNLHILAYSFTWQSTSFHSASSHSWCYLFGNLWLEIKQLNSFQRIATTSPTLLQGIDYWEYKFPVKFAEILALVQSCSENMAARLQNSFCELCLSVVF